MDIWDTCGLRIGRWGGMGWDRCVSICLHVYIEIAVGIRGY